MTPSDSSSPWLDGLTIPQVFDATIEKFAEREAVVFPRLGLRLTYRQLAEQVEQTARGLLACGIGRGEHVAIWATNLPEWIVLQFATARIGAVLVTINPAYRAHELKYVLKQSDAVALVLTDRYKSSDYFAMLGEVCPEVNRQSAAGDLPQIRSTEFPKLRRIIAIKGAVPPAAISWQQLLDVGNAVPSAAVREAATGMKAGDPINIQYTSGTTGFPKAAMLSHRNLLMNVFYGGICQALTERDRICIPVPFYHCFGCVLGTSDGDGSRRHDGAAGRIVRSRGHARCHRTRTLHLAVRRADDVYCATERSFIAGRNLKSLRTGIMAGSPCPIETMRAVVDRLGCREITIGYGQTEASPIITQTRTDDPIELRVETVGRPLPGVEVKVDRSRHRPSARRAISQGSCARRALRDAGLLITIPRRPVRRSTPRVGCTPAIWRFAAQRLLQNHRAD